MSVGIVEMRIRSQHEASSDDGAKLASSVACSLQMQLMALYYDRLFRSKNVDKFGELLNLHPGWQSVRFCFFHHCYLVGLRFDFNVIWQPNVVKSKQPMFSLIHIICVI